MTVSKRDSSCGANTASASPPEVEAGHNHYVLVTGEQLAQMGTQLVVGIG
ncbi:hypothetical protein ACT3TC_02280 [Halomonas sp. AOP27-A1-41]